MNSSRRFRKKPFWILAAALIALNACDNAPAPKSGGQALVRVNNEEITARQVNYVLAHFPQDRRQDQGLARTVAERSVDQQLLLQMALKNRLDSDPDVMLAMEHARRQILAQAYLDKIGGEVAAPSEAEIKNYYSRHPELFAHRKMYRVQQIVVSRSLPFSALKAKVNGGMSTADLVRWLQAGKMLVNAGTSVSPAENISAEILPKLHAMKKGDRLAWETPEHHVVVVLLGATEQPLTQARAAPLIGKFLSGEKRRARGQEELARLRRSATIRWMGDFAERPTAVENRWQPRRSPDRRPLDPNNAGRGFAWNVLSVSR